MNDPAASGRGIINRGSWCLFWSDWREGAVFLWLICGGDRSSRLRENAEGARNAPADKSQKTPARETRNEIKGSVTPNQCRIQKFRLSNWSNG